MTTPKKHTNKTEASLNERLEKVKYIHILLFLFRFETPTNKTQYK